MPSSPATRRGTRKLSEVARVVSKPTGITATGWGDVETICARMGVEFDEWQKGVGRLALAKRSNGNLAAMIDGVGLSLPRQVGKTYLMSGLVFALCILRPGTLVIWTAQHSSTHEETFLSMQGFAARHRVKPYVDRVYTGSGDEEVRFANGSRILFGARERGFGRGIPGVDVLVFDEAQHLSERALDAMVATMNTSRFGLAFFIGTPPRPEDNSESFARMRQDALEGKLTNGVWVECGADENAGPDDRDQWAKANPSYPGRTPAESILRLRSKLTEESFLREALGIWDVRQANGVIPEPSWTAQLDTSSLAVDAFSLGIEVGPDLQWASVALSGRRADGSWHVALEATQHVNGRGTTWLEPLIDDLVSNNPQFRAVVVDVGGPINPLLTQRGSRYWLTRPDGSRGVEVTPLSVDELAGGCVNMLTGVVVGDVWHLDQPALTAAALSASKRAIKGDSARWVWHRRGTNSDITPIQAATYALIGSRMDKPKRPGRRSSSNEGSVVVL